MASGGRRTPMQIELPPSRFADLDGPVHYVEWDGPPGRTFVLVHGLGGSLLSWLAVAPGLARHGRGTRRARRELDGRRDLDARGRAPARGDRRARPVELGLPVEARLLAAGAG